MSLATGQLLQKRYRIASLLGQGGMGAVYRAWDIRLNVPVAVKELVPQPGLDATTLDRLRLQFDQEAQVLARLDHSHLVNVTDYFEEGGRAYLVMRYIEGESLADHIKRVGALDETRVRIWATQILDALDYCHAQRILHRDIKPQNVIITPAGNAILVDFGLVKLWDPRDPHTRTVIRGSGTPAYAPPEQYDAVAGHTDARSDLYSLGATLYHALTGQAPPTATQRMVDAKALHPLSELNPRVSPSLERAVHRALEPEPAARFQSAQEMVSALRETDVPTTVLDARRTPTSLWIIGAVVLLAILVVGIGLRRLALRASDDPEPTRIAQATPSATAQTLSSKISPTETSAPTATPTAQAEVMSLPTATITAHVEDSPTHTPRPEPTATPQPTATPVPEPIVTFAEGFDNLNTATWHLDRGSGDAFVDNGVLRMASSGSRYPYVYTQTDPFPAQGDFAVTIRFRYPSVRTCGVGVIVSDYLAPAGLSQQETADRMQAAESRGVLAGVWQDKTNGLQIWFRSGADRADLPSPITSGWNTLTVEYIAGRYNLYLNGQRVYASQETLSRPRAIWMGHPARLAGPCEWVSLDVDYIEIESVPLR